MKLTSAFAILIDLRYAIQWAFLPTIQDLWRTPALIFKPAMLSHVFMAHVWVGFGNPTDEGGKAVKLDLITPNAHGTVLDIGAGQTIDIHFPFPLHFLRR
jgi:hypothetical protein